jgi:hypothetical protein
MNQSRASSIFISFIRATLFILCLHTPPTHSMSPQRPGHRRHRSIYDIETGTLFFNSGASGRAPRGIAFAQPVPEEERLRPEPSIAQIRQDPVSSSTAPAEPSAAPTPKIKKLRRRNALRRSDLARPLGSPRISNSKHNLADTSTAQAAIPATAEEGLGAPAQPDNAPRKPSFFAQLFCCCACTRSAQ